MKKLSIKHVAILTMLFASVAHAGIPSEFIGHYESKPSDCNLKGDAADFSNHIYVTKSGYSGFEYSCRAVTTLEQSTGKYVAKMTCDGAGDYPSQEKISFKLQNNKFTLTQTNGSDHYVKCSK